MLNKEWFNSIEYRESTRAYNNQELDEGSIYRLQTLISEINSKHNLNFQFVRDCSRLFDGFRASYGLLNGVKSCIALVVSKSLSQYKNKVGYYGEMLVLEATAMGIGTCWIGGTYDKYECKNYINIKDNEEIVCLIAIGYGLANEKILQKLVRRANKKRKEFKELLIENDREIPAWVSSGINSVIKAPSAMNKQPIGYMFKDNIISAYTVKKNYGFEDIDLGISMLHFELGAENQGYSGMWKYESSEDVYKFYEV